MAENYLQHAEHYNRIIMAAQAQSAQPVAQNGADAGYSLNGAHRHNREMNGAMRDQPQPHVDQQPFVDRRPPAPVDTPHQPTVEQTATEDGPVAKEAVVKDVAKESDKDESAGDGDSGRRRGGRRRYPGGSASVRSGTPSGGNAEKKEKAAATSSGDDQPSDEIAAQ